MRKCFYMLAVVIASLSLMSCIDEASNKGVDYSDFGIIIRTYQVPGDKPHQYIKFEYGGAHYPECKYCKSKMKQYNFLLKDATNFTIGCEQDISDEIISNIRIYLNGIALNDVVSNPNFKETIRATFSLPEITISYSNNI